MILVILSKELIKDFIDSASFLLWFLRSLRGLSGRLMALSTFNLD